MSAVGYCPCGICQAARALRRDSGLPNTVCGLVRALAGVVNVMQPVGDAFAHALDKRLVKTRASVWGCPRCSPVILKHGQHSLSKLSRRRAGRNVAKNVWQHSPQS